MTPSLQGQQGLGQLVQGEFRLVDEDGEILRLGFALVLQAFEVVQQRLRILLGGRGRLGRLLGFSGR